MGCLNWRESRAEGRAEQKSSDLIPVQARDWLSRKRNPVRPPVSPVPAKPIFKEGMLEGRLDPHVQFQPPMETRSYHPGWGGIGVPLGVPLCVPLVSSEVPLPTCGSLLFLDCLLLLNFRLFR
jgi:hypothetical protein